MKQRNNSDNDYDYDYELCNVQPINDPNLLKATRHNELEYIKAHLTSDNYNERLLSIACNNKFYDIVEYIVNKFGSSIITDRSILVCIKNNSINILNLLLKNNSDYSVLVECLYDSLPNLPIDYCIICKKGLPLRYLLQECIYCNRTLQQQKQYIYFEKQCQQEEISRQKMQQIREYQKLQEKQQRTLNFVIKHNSVFKQRQLSEVIFDLDAIQTHCLGCEKVMAYKEYSPLKYPNWINMEYFKGTYYNKMQKYCGICFKKLH